MVFDAYTQFEESVLTAKMRMAEVRRSFLSFLKKHGLAGGVVDPCVTLIFRRKAFCEFHGARLILMC